MTDVTQEEVDPLRVRRPPRGLTRAERRDWQEEQAQRVADVRDQGRTGGFRAVRATAPPRGLGRAGRRAWRDADRENRARRMETEAARSASDRYVGALVLMVILGVVVAARIVLSGSSDDAPTPAAPSGPVVGTDNPATTAATTAVALSGTPQDAVRAWYTLVCPSSSVDPQSARLARGQVMMTPQGWADLDHSNPPPIAEWTCGPVTTDMPHPVTNGLAVVYYTADVTVAGSPATTVRQARMVSRQPDGTWLVGPLAAAG